MADSDRSEAVREKYDGADARVYELIMGELLHIGGLASSLELVDRAGIAEGSHGVDLCCGNGGSMRMLVQMAGVDSMVGVEFSEKQVERAVARTQEAALSDKIRIVLGDACDTGLPDGVADFVWGEDAWCYVSNKARVLTEALRVVKPGGTIAFTDWTLGPTALTDDERRSFFAIMRFPGLWTAADYQQELQAQGCEVVEVADTTRFAPCFQLFGDMLELQLGWEAVRLADQDAAMVDSLTAGLNFIRDLGLDNKVVQTRVIARRGA